MWPWRETPSTSLVGLAGLRVINVADLAAPVEVGFYDTPGDAQGVAVAGSFAYVADGSSGLHVVNVANPAAPTEVGFYDIPGDAQGVAVAGNHAYVADVYSLRVIDVANPAAPVEVGFCDIYGAWDVAVAGNHAYVASYRALRVIDVANPAGLSRSGSTPRRCWPRAWRWWEIAPTSRTPPVYG